MKILAVYPGRFQPFHKGHAQVFQWLKNKFGDAVIATSDKVEAPKSPFNFKEKKKMMTLAGVPAGKIKQVSNPYIAREILKDYDPKTTVLVFAVSQKDMDEDPRFSFKPTRSGKPGYLQPYAGNEKKLQPFGDSQSPKGYVVVTPTFTFDVLGKPATSASELRKQFVSLDNNKQKEFIKDLFGKYDESVHKLMKEKIGAMEKQPKTIKQLKEGFGIGLTHERSYMPQIGASASFVKYLKNNGVDSQKTKLDPNELRSSQMEFDTAKIEGLRATPSKNPIIVSNDNHVIDGHHRWLADQLEGRHSDAYVCDLPALDLLHHAKIYSNQLKEEVTHKELAPMLDAFVSFASDKLGIKSLPSVRYKNDDDDYNSFAAYNPSSNELSVSTKNRHPMDVFRSVAHELVHHKQNEDGRIGKDVAKEGETGSDIENEANAEAGKIMRWFAKANPKMFAKTHIVEDIANNAAGAPIDGIRGLGLVSGAAYLRDGEMQMYVNRNSSFVNHDVNNLVQAHTDMHSRESDGDYERLKNADIAWSDHPKDQILKKPKSISQIKEQLTEGINDPGKLKAIFLAGGPGSGKDFVMNSVLQGEGLREINSDTAFEFLMKKHGLDMEMPDEEKVERDIVRGRAKGMTKEKERLSLAGRLGLIINGTADDIEKIKTVKKALEADGYETMMVFVNTSNEVSRQRNIDRGKMGGRKVPDGTDKNGTPDGSEDIRSEKWQLAQQNIGELQKVFGNNNFAVIDNSTDIRKADDATKAKVQADFSRVRRMAQQFVRAENKNPAAKKWIEGEAEKRGITDYQPPKRYKTLTQVRQSVPQVVHKPDNEMMAQARRMGLSYYGFGRFGRKVGGENKVLFHSKGGRLVRVQMTEGKNPCWKGYKQLGMKSKNGKKVPNCVPIDETFEGFLKSMSKKKLKPKRKALNQEALTAPEPWGYNFGADGIGPTMAVPRAGTPYGFGYGSAYSASMSESIVSWMQAEKTQKKFMSKYGDLWEDKLVETAVMLENCGCGSAKQQKKTITKVREGMEGGVNNMSMVPSQRKSDDFDEQTEMEIKPRGYANKFDTVKMDPSRKPHFERERARKQQVAKNYHPERLLPGMHEQQLNERGADSKGLYRSTESGAGLTAKGAKHFGVKTAVTTPPSKLKKGSKAAKRRKSFCARMGGMKGPMKDEKGRPTRKAMSLRRWNCEE